MQVLAASDLKFALTRVAALYQKETGQSVALTFGSSGNMARQIQQGLSAHIYMSADEDLVLQLVLGGWVRVGGERGDLPAPVAPGEEIALGDGVGVAEFDRHQEPVELLFGQRIGGGRERCW